MKTSSFYFALCLIFLSISCTSKESSETNSAETTLQDTTSKAVETSVEMTDPDPADDIAVEEYNAASISLENAEKVKTFLQKQFKDDIEKGLLEETERKFVQYEYDLNDDGNNEILVGLVGPYFCGSGGCTQFVLDQDGNLITAFSVADYPVIIDSTKSNGWKNLIIYSGGKNRVVKFDGKKYPSNPSIEPAQDNILEEGLPRALDFINDKYPWFKF